MYIYSCKPDFESMMTCIYDVWADKKGSQNVRLCLEPIEQQELFSTYIHVEYDPVKTRKVIHSICQKISDYVYQQIYLAAMTEHPDRLDIIYRFLQLGFTYGPSIMQHMTEEPVVQLFCLSRRAGNEMHHFREFIRFNRIKPDIYVSHIEPSCNIAALTAQHFQDRMPSEHWMIIDDLRRFAVIHQKNEPIYVTTLSELEWQRLKATEQACDDYSDLWQEFFDTIGIKERENYHCQKNLFPLRLRKHVTEFSQKVK